MEVVLEQVRPAMKNARTWLASGQKITLGASRWADFHLRGDPTLPAQCAELEVRDGDCFIYETAVSRSVLRIDGQASSGCALTNGATFRVGSIELRVHWEIRPEAQHPSAPPLPRFELLQVPLREGIKQLNAPESNPWPLHHLLRQLASHCPLMLLVNGRGAGPALPVDIADSEDMYQHAPAEIRAEYSMHVVGDRAFEELWELYEPIADRDVCIWAAYASEESLEDVLNKARLYLAWFAKPSILQFTLSKSNGEMAEKLMGPFLALCLPQSLAGQWVLYSPDSVANETLGLAHDQLNDLANLQT